jgi:carbamoyl-phosphate synthase large subunit
MEKQCRFLKGKEVDMKLNILFTSVGRRVSLINSFKKSLKDLCIDGKIIAVDANEDSAARYVSDIHLKLPRVNGFGYIDSLLSVCNKYDVDIIIPLIDTELLVLAKNRKLFEEISVTLLLSSFEDIEICNDKNLTYKFLSSNGFDTPRILDKDLLLSHQTFPLFIKPANGSSSINAFEVHNIDELKFFSSYISQPIIQELIRGKEYTIDVFVDFQGKVRSVVPRLRIETRAGEISKGITVKNQFLIKAAKELVEKMYKPLGCITVQCFLTEDNKIKFIEINPRFGGGFPLSYEAGANFPSWILQTYLKQEVKIKIDGWEDGLKMLRYDEAIFLSKEKA